MDENQLKKIEELIEKAKLNVDGYVEKLSNLLHNLNLDMWPFEMKTETIFYNLKNIYDVQNSNSNINPDAMLAEYVVIIKQRIEECKTEMAKQETQNKIDNQIKEVNKLLKKSQADEKKLNLLNSISAIISQRPKEGPIKRLKERAIKRLVPVATSAKVREAKERSSGGGVFGSSGGSLLGTSGAAGFSD